MAKSTKELELNLNEAQTSAPIEGSTLVNTPAPAAMKEGETKLDFIERLIITGRYTRKQLAELSGSSPAVVASLLTDLRMIAKRVGGNFPMENEDNKTMFMGTAEDYAKYEDARAARGVGVKRESKPITPAAAVERAQKRENTASTKFSNAKKRAEDSPEDKVFAFKVQIADLELQLASTMLHYVEQGEYKYETGIIVTDGSDVVSGLVNDDTANESDYEATDSMI